MDTVNEYARISADAQQLYAIELLEYHNINYLSGDNKTRSEIKQALLKDIMNICNMVAGAPI